MSDWQSVPAGSVVQFTRGVSWTAERERELPTKSTRRVLRIPNVQADLVLDDVLLVDFPGGVPEKWRATPGSIVMVGSNGNPRRVGNAIQILPSDGDFLFASFLIVARACVQDLDERYLFHWIRSTETQDLITRSVHGSTGLSNLSMSFLCGLPLPSPPLKEQRRIAEILDTIDDTIEVTERVISKTARIREAVLDGLMSGLGFDSAGSIAEVLQDPLCYGIVQVGGHVQDGIPVVAIRDLGGAFGSDLHRTSPMIDQQYPRSRVTGGEVLLSIKGTVGRVGVVPRKFRGNISRDVALLRTNTKVNGPFLALFLESREGQRRLRRIAVGTTRAELSIHALREILVPIPGATDQSRIVAAMRNLDARRAAEDKKLSKLRQLRSGLAADLLSGRVRTVAA